MSIYTKRGDKGLTDLIGGTRANKADIRLEAYGTADELNSFVGLLRAECGDRYPTLADIQNRLFNLGAYLATDQTKTTIGDWAEIKDSDITQLENDIDAMESEIPPLKQFILPAGSRPVCLAHVCRTVTRRLERCIISMQQQYPIDENITKYVNRLSDYFFVLAKKINHSEGKDFIFWKK